jgi:cell division protein FtsB
MPFGQASLRPQPMTKPPQVSVETCDEHIAQENDHLKREVKKLELEVSKLKKQHKVQPPQDNHNNMVNKLEKGKSHQSLILNH